MKPGHGGAVWKFLKDSETERQSLLNAGTLLSCLHLLQLLEVLIKFQVVENHSHKQTQHNLFAGEVVMHTSQPSINLLTLCKHHLNIY